MLSKKVVTTCVVVFLVPILWHLFLCVSIMEKVKSENARDAFKIPSLSVTLNPFTNLATIRLSLNTSNASDPIESLSSRFSETLIEAVGPSVIERELNTRARERFDVYAILLPYRVRIDISERVASSAKAEFDASESSNHLEYISTYLELQSVRVEEGERYGKQVNALFGTLVNNGQETLSRVKLRVFFLDSFNKKIGEVDFTPVLTSEYSSVPPLRPGYRKDFGYSLEDAAPTGWVRKVDAYIVEIEFASAP